MELPEGAEWEAAIKGVVNELMNENIPNLEKELENKIQEVNRTPKSVDQKWISLGHVIIKLSSVE